ncbi:hypothetical protein SASPL_141290 [Salvia splendens]|uniref:Retrotransposon gag domain-containing protein n=1 Tax=Salvia splendens TaxID=180675 RepID=A0A8X8WRV9_SALSN|nr:hypothetical protein SASPL_141290 [Salvia splendens]
MAPLPRKHGVITWMCLAHRKADGRIDSDWGIGSLHAHDEKEPTHAITVTLGIRAIAIKSGVLAVYCDIQPVPAGSTSEDYRIKAIPFVLEGNARIWLRRLPEGSIRTWAEFRMTFLDHFFPASKTSALKREITEARQEWESGRFTQPSMADSRWTAKMIST